MADVVRLDFAGPPPGYAWDERRNGYLRDIYDDLVGSLADAWKHYKARFDPPGMKTLNVRMSGWWCPYVQHADGELYPVDATVRDAETQEIARAAAWRWYEARLTLYNILRKINPPREFWPVILTWSDQDVIEVHGFLVEHADVIMLGGADGLTFPQVLCG